jgi:hypothetical protein
LLSGNSWRSRQVKSETCEFTQCSSTGLPWRTPLFKKLGLWATIVTCWILIGLFRALCPPYCVSACVVDMLFAVVMCVLFVSTAVDRVVDMLFAVVMCGLPDSDTAAKVLDQMIDLHLIYARPRRHIARRDLWLRYFGLFAFSLQPFSAPVFACYLCVVVVTCASKDTPSTAATYGSSSSSSSDADTLPLPGPGSRSRSRSPDPQLAI